MLATTIQITNNPPHTTTPNKPSGRLRGQPPQQVDANTVLNVNPTACLLATTFMPNPKKRTHTHHPLAGSEHMRAQEEQTHTPTTKGHHARLLPTKRAP